MTSPVLLDHPLLPKPPLQLYTHNADSDLVSHKLQTEKIWEIHETRLILENLKNCKTFIDVGANIGYYSLLAARQMDPQSSIFAFEPDPNNFSLLEKNCAVNKLDNIHAYNLALGDAPGELSLYLSEDNRGDHRSYASQDTRESIQIACCCGDDILADYDTVDFIKMDTQGAEYRIIKGMQQTLARSREKLKMIVEFWPWGLRQNGGSCFELLVLLDKLDLPLHIIDHVAGGIYSSSRNELENWMRETDADPENQGFINLFVGQVNT